jgi:hypothetical protein
VQKRWAKMLSEEGEDIATWLRWLRAAELSERAVSVEIRRQARSPAPLYRRAVCDKLRRTLKATFCRPRRQSDIIRNLFR